MKKGRYRKAVFMVVYKNPKDLKYLILKRKLHWKGWEFPKGGIGPKEIVRKTILRELREEEGGLKAKKIKNHRVSGKYKYGKKIPEREEYIGQTYSLYSIEVGKGRVKIDRKEHTEYKWVDFKAALRMLKWPNQRRCLSVVNKSLER